MGPGFVILFWLLIAGVFGIFWMAGLVIFLIGKSKRSRLMMWLGGIPVASLTMIALAIAGLIGFGIIRATNPRYVYKDAFGERPSADVTTIRSKVYSFADEAHVFLTFRAAPETIHRIVPKYLKKVRYDEYCREMSGNNLTPPPWWKPPDQSTNEIYLLSTDFGQGKRFATETTVMTYDHQTKTAMYFYLGID